jgi:hypothetical protein
MLYVLPVRLYNGINMDTSKLSRRAQSFFRLIEFDPDEKIICEVRKHPLGLAIIYLTGIFVASAVFLLLVLGSLFVRNDPLDVGTSTAMQAAVVVAGGLLTIIIVLATAVGAYLYKSNVVIVTSEKIAQLLYRTIFDRKISQLSLGDVQDVTVNQKGVFARMFNYGTLTIETSGEQANFIFTFTPDPYERAKDIVGAHERNVAQFGN